MFRAATSGSRRRVAGARERGASSLEYAALLALAALILGALVAVGIPGTVSARAGSAVCSILHASGSCGDGARPAKPAARSGGSSDGSRSSRSSWGAAADRVCHEMLGDGLCSFQERVIVGGEWGELKEQGTGIK